MKVVTTGSIITVLAGTEVSKLAVGSVTFGICAVGLGLAVGDAVGAGDAVGGGVVGDGDGDAVGAGVAVGGGVVGDGDGVAVAGGVAVAVGVGVIVPMMVIKPSFCNGTCGSKFVSTNWNGFSVGGMPHLNIVEAPGVLLTRTHLVLNRTPAPLSGVIASFEKAEMRKVLNVPGPVFSTFDPTVNPGPAAVSPAGRAEEANGVGMAIAESKMISAEKPM